MYSLLIKLCAGVTYDVWFAFLYFRSNYIYFTEQHIARILLDSQKNPKKTSMYGLNNIAKERQGKRLGLARTMY